MRRFQLAALCLLLHTTAFAFNDRARMTVSLRHRGERIEATFISNIHGFTTIAAERPVFLRLAEFLDDLRFKRYVGNRLSDVEQEKLRQGFFSHERLAQHDELLILHRGMDTENAEVNGPSGLGPEILAAIAVDRLGHPKPEYHASYRVEDYEKLLFERRLQDLGIEVPRPVPEPWNGDGLPPGVYRHWDPFVGLGFFEPGRIYTGDVIQVNGFFASEDLAPLLYTLASRYGLFSTGRIVYPARTKIIEGVSIPGYAVIVPTLVVWETFNKRVDGERIEGSRTRYYQATGAVPLEIGGINEWLDLSLGSNVLVQILSKTGEAFRRDWMRQVAPRRDLNAVSSTVIERTRFEVARRGVVDGSWLAPGHQSMAHHPANLRHCVTELLARL